MVNAVDTYDWPEPHIGTAEASCLAVLSSVNVALSVDETYADVMPVRMKDSISAFV